MAKRVIGISTFTYDIAGNRTLYINPASIEKINQGRRRATRTKTLDGGAVVYDAGFSVADLTLNIEVSAAGQYAGAFFAMLVQSYNLIRVTIESGVYSCVPASWEENNGIARLEALVMEQLA